MILSRVVVVVLARKVDDRGGLPRSTGKQVIYVDFAHQASGVATSTPKFRGDWVYLGLENTQERLRKQNQMQRVPSPTPRIMVESRA